MYAGKTNILYSNIKDTVSATTNVTLREKESDAEQTTPQATFTRVVGVLFYITPKTYMAKVDGCFLRFDPQISNDK